MQLRKAVAFLKELGSTLVFLHVDEKNLSSKQSNGIMEGRLCCLKEVVQNLKHQSLILRTAFFVYLISVLYITLLAWNYGASLGPSGPGGRNYNVIPLRSIYRIAMFSPTAMDPIRILIGNVILFIPLGFLIPAIWRKMRKQVKIVAIGFLVSLSIELSQFLFTHRVANIDDVLLNSFGTWIGACIFYLCYRLKRRIVILYT